jgi:hypothetical protein
MNCIDDQGRLQAGDPKRSAGIPERRRPFPTIKNTSLVLGETGQQVTEKGLREIEDTH